MRHAFRHLGGTLNTQRCTHCGAIRNSTVEHARCLWRDGVAEAFRAIRALSGLTRREAYRRIYGPFDNA